MNHLCLEPVIPEARNVRWCHLPVDHLDDHITIWLQREFRWPNERSTT